jgi:hypothetical protein
MTDIGDCDPQICIFWTQDLETAIENVGKYFEGLA